MIVKKILSYEKLRIEICTSIALGINLRKSKRRKMAHYGKIEYWEDRYKKDNSAYDWYQKYNGLKDIITQHVDFDMKILDLGAGNSGKFFFFNFHSNACLFVFRFGRFYVQCRLQKN